MAYEMRIRDWSSDVCSSDLCIILIYLAYLSVTGPMLWRRLKGWPDGTPTVDAEGKKLFSLGRFGIPINLLAVIYGLALVVNLAWPDRKSVVSGKRVSVRVALGGRRILKTKKKTPRKT